MKPENNTECLFCKIAKGEIKSDFIYEDDNFFAIYDIDPITPGHAMVIPKNHYKTFIDIPNTMGLELLDAIKKVTLKIISETQAESFNLMVVGEDVSHVHIHVIPRKKGDGIKPLVNLNRIAQVSEKAEI
ncbi:HIT family protein [Candidatus Pacearchaeota archaeon]|nr:HIT family protein [Candidatus Pacearchaeota archaeon]